MRVRAYERASVRASVRAVACVRVCSCTRARVCVPLIHMHHGAGEAVGGAARPRKHRAHSFRRCLTLLYTG